jgi:putative spermidine/putrescine transport system permease protein
MTRMSPGPAAARARKARGLGILIVLFLAAAAPFAAFILNAFSFRWFYPQLLPAEWSLRAWARIAAPRFGLFPALANSLGIALFVTLVSLVLGLPAARALGMREFKGKRLAEFFILAPIMVPALPVGMGLSVIFVRIGLAGSYLGVALAHLVPVLPYVVLTLAAVFRGYDDALEAQARTLGAGPLRVLFSVTLPSIAPGLSAAGLFAFLISFSQYLLTLLVGGGRIITLPVLLFSTIPGGDNAAIAALSLVFVLPSLFILIATSRVLNGRPGELSGLGRI